MKIVTSMLTVTLLALVMVLPSIVTAQQSQLTLTTPAPPPIVSVGANYTGGGNYNTPIYYWAVVRYPSGAAIPTGPAIANGTPGSSNLNATHLVTISWTSMPNATGYDVVRSDTPNYPAPCNTCAVVLNTALTSITDTGNLLSDYPPAGLGSVSAATATMTVNNSSEALPFINMQLMQGVFKSALIDPTATVGSAMVLASGGRLVGSGVFAPFTYPAAGIPCSTGLAWCASYTTTGSGTVVALKTSPVFVTPTLGVASATSVDFPTTTSATSGVIFKNGARWMHNYQDISLGDGQNIFVGRNAGNFTMTAAAVEHTVVGVDAMPAITSGLLNTAIGFRALFNATTLQNTVAVGVSAGRFIVPTTPLLTGSFHVLIGSDSRPSADGTTNEIVIGGNARGTGTNQTVIGNSSTTQANIMGTVYQNGTARLSQTSCQPGLGDGLNVIPAGTYLETTCFNDTGVNVMVTGVKCYTDNSGTSTLNVTNQAGTAMLTGAITCTTAFAAGTQSALVTLANGEYMKFTFVSDGVTKQTTWVVTQVR